jgi:hypothetical protein
MKIIEDEPTNQSALENKKMQKIKIAETPAYKEMSK